MMQRCRHLSFWISTIVIVFSSIHILMAQRIEEPIQDFFIARTVFSQERGEVQVTFGPSFLRSKDVNQTELRGEAEYGISDRLQVGLEALYLFGQSGTGERTSGPGNIEIGVLYNFLSTTQPFALSALFEIALPCGEEPVAEDEIEFETWVVLAKTLGAGQIHVSLGVETSSVETVFLYNVASVFPMSRVFFLTFEFNGVEILEDSPPHFTPGFYYRLVNSEPLVELGLGSLFALAGERINHGVIAKLTVEF